LKARDAALSEVVLTDVCPYSLGVGVAERGPDGNLREGIFSPIIERNTVIPASRLETYYTLRDKQPSVTFHIFQGESRLVADNIHLGNIDLPVPHAPAGDIAVECRFSYDINGLLEVNVHVPRTGERRELVIVDKEGMSDAELSQRRAALALLKQHPREADQNRSILARAARCYEAQLGDRRRYVGQLILDFEAVLDRQEPRAVDHAREDLSRALDAIDGEVWL
jgi:molecular chaperone HscC